MSRKLFSLIACLVLVFSFVVVQTPVQAEEGDGTISGVVTEQGTGEVIKYIEVAACPYDFEMGEYVEGMPCYSGWTDVTGSYIIENVPAGTYIVDSGWSGNWVVEIYSEQVDYSSADSVVVEADTPTLDIDFTLELGGSISGTVTEEGTGNLIKDMEVAACPYNFETGGYVEGMPCYSGWTEEDGRYFIRGVPAGTYIVDSGWSGNWVVEIYSERVDYSSADPVVVEADKNKSDVNFTLELGGSISGTVTEEGTGNPIEGMEVAACPFYYEEGMPCYSGWTEADGSYFIRGVPFGTYRLDSGWSGNWVVEYYKNTPSWENAKPVKIKPAHGNSSNDKHINVTGIDFTLELGGSISGTVINQDTEEGVEGMEVAACLYDVDAGEYVEGMPCYSGWTEANGSYFIRGVPAGTYIVDSGWSGNWVPVVYPYPVTVVADENTSDIDFALEMGE